MVHYYVGQSKSMIERINLLVQLRIDLLRSDSDDDGDVLVCCMVLSVVDNCLLAATDEGCCCFGC